MKKKYFAGVIICYVITGILILGSSINNNMGYSINDTVLAEKTDDVSLSDREVTSLDTEGELSGGEDEKQAQTTVMPQPEIVGRKESGDEDSSRESAQGDVQTQDTFQKVDKEYLEDALFIGDSRTLGLMEYGGVSQTSFFADSGMSVFNLEKVSVPVAGHGKIGLKKLLQKEKFGKIYFMMGINEAGYPWKTLKQKYREMVDLVQKLQPDAKIFLCGNLMMTKEKSGQSKAINNEVIGKINTMIEKLASQKEMYYIDVNEIFTDEKGNLKESYSNDGVHVLGKYYREWMDWICTKGVV